MKAFSAAALSGVEAVKKLVASGKDINAKDEYGDTALMNVAVIRNVADIGNVAVIQALRAGGADINAQNNSGKTALIAVADFGRPAVVRTLLASGADANIRDSRGETALMRTKDDDGATKSQYIEHPRGREILNLLLDTELASVRAHAADWFRLRDLE